MNTFTLSDTAQKAYAKGFHAAQDGEARNKNPYAKDDPNREQWFRGWKVGSPPKKVRRKTP